MTMRVRAGLTMILAVAMMGLASCDHYNCASGPNLGTSCTASGSGIGTTGTGGSATAAFVFVADAGGTGKTGTIDGYTLNTAVSTFLATPSYIAPTTPLGDGGVGMVVAQSKYLYTGFRSTNTIDGWLIGTDGSLTTLNNSPYPAPFMGLVPSGFGTQSVITNPTGTLLFFSNGLDKIYVYQIGSDGSLTTATGSPFSVPFSPGNLATDGQGKYLYITETLSNHTGLEIGAYAIGSTGSLTLVPGSPFAFPMWQVQGDPTGNFLIGTKGDSAVQGFSGMDNAFLYVFSIAQSGATAGAITQVGSPVATAASPLSIAVQSNTTGNLVYTFGIEDSQLGFDPVEGYSLSSAGVLTAVTGSPFTSPANLGDLGQFDPSGAFMFTYGGILDSSTNTVTYQMGAIDVASGGALTQPTATLTLASGGFFAVADPQ